MRILIASIGRFKAGPERDLFQQYAKRLPWKLELRELDAKSARTAEAEARLLLAACDGYARVVAMDERGTSLTSAAFAEQLNRWQVQGHSSCAFLIGGADGLHESVRARADLLLSLGAATWPHLLVRGLLAEQLYRAHTLISGHPYHRA